MKIRKLAVAVAAVAVLTVASTMLAGCSNGDHRGSSSSSVDFGAAPSVADEQGGIAISSVGVGVVGNGDVVVDVYVEPLCPPCAHFETGAGRDLVVLTEQPGVTVRYHIVSFLDDRMPQLNNYGMRAASALAVVAEKSPEHYTAFLTALFEHQQAAKSGTSSDADIKAVAARAGVPVDVLLLLASNGVDGLPVYASFVNQTTLTAQSSLQKVGGLSTPTVLVNGQRADWSDGAALLSAIEAAKG